MIGVRLQWNPALEKFRDYFFAVEAANLRKGKQTGGYELAFDNWSFCAISAFFGTAG